MAYTTHLMIWEMLFNTVYHHSPLTTALFIVLDFKTFVLNLQVIKFAVGQSSTFTFPLRNSGDIPLDVDVQFFEWPELFSVSPVRVHLDPGQQVMSSVTFRHRFECHATQYERYTSLWYNVENLFASGSQCVLLYTYCFQCFVVVGLSSERASKYWLPQQPNMYNRLKLEPEANNAVILTH